MKTKKRYYMKRKRKYNRYSKKRGGDYLNPSTWKPSTWLSRSSWGFGERQQPQSATNLPPNQPPAVPLTDQEKSKYFQIVGEMRGKIPEKYDICEYFPEDKEKFLNFISRLKPINQIVIDSKDDVLKIDSACKIMASDPTIKKIKDRLIIEIENLKKEKEKISQDLDNKNNMIDALTNNGIITTSTATLSEEEEEALKTQRQEEEEEENKNEYERGGKRRRTKRRRTKRRH